MHHPAPPRGRGGGGGPGRAIERRAAEARRAQRFRGSAGLASAFANDRAARRVGTSPRPESLRPPRLRGFFPRHGGQVRTAGWRLLARALLRWRLPAWATPHVELHRKHKRPHLPPPPAVLPTFVVGIGASAGGLEALERSSTTCPKDTGMAFVLVQHLSPDFKSLMDELLARHTDAADPPGRGRNDGRGRPRLSIPPKKEMIISGGRLLLSERDRQHELTLPIDVFFRSLAQDCGPARHRDRALRRRERRIARHPRRPRRRRAGRRPGRRERAVRRHAQDRARRRRATGCSRRRTCRASPATTPRSAAKGARPPASRRRAAFARRLAGDRRRLPRCSQKEFGIDFTHYKPSTVTRRIERRLLLSAPITSTTTSSA